MRNSYRNISCFKKAELKGMKNESGEINVGVEGGQLWPRRSKEGGVEVSRLGCDQNFLPCLQDLKCQSFHLSYESYTWSQNGWF